MALSYESLTLSDNYQNSLTLKGRVITIHSHFTGNETKFMVSQQHQANSIIDHFREHWTEHPTDKDRLIEGLRRDVKSMTLSRDYYKRIADKKYDMYNREHELTKGRLKALEIEREVYLSANETLKGFLQVKAVLIKKITDTIENPNLSYEDRSDIIGGLLIDLKE